jgi:hypothetical protein
LGSFGVSFVTQGSGEVGAYQAGSGPQGYLQKADRGIMRRMNSSNPIRKASYLGASTGFASSGRARGFIFLLVLMPFVAAGCTKARLINPYNAQNKNAPITDSAVSSPGFAVTSGGTHSAQSAHFRLQGSVHFVSAETGNPTATNTQLKPGLQGVLAPAQ